jgi:hypothetical protein
MPEQKDNPAAVDSVVKDSEDTPKKIPGAYPGQWKGGPRDRRIRELNSRG